MNKIVGDAAVSCYVDAAALLIMVLLLLLSERLRKRKNATLKVFYAMCLSITANCVFAFICDAMYMQTAPWAHAAAMIAKTLRECGILLITILWLMYVDRKLYREKDRLSNTVRILFFAPFAVFFILLIVNLFTGIVFICDENNQIENRPLLHVIFVVEFAYFVLSAFMVSYYDRKSMKLRFIRVSPMILSIVVASGSQFFTPYDIGILGFVMGITLLYFSTIGEIRFVDEESGLYNTGYLAYLFDLAVAGKNDTHSALILEAEGDLKACFEILRSTLHRSGDVIRAEEDRFVMFSSSDSRSSMQYLTSLVDEAVEKYDLEHPDNRVRISVRCSMRTGEEDAFTFLRSAMTQKDVGDEMRGVVSMMSELDRLDKELALAADIQINMLPTKFPAFPDRRDFDLYAFMTPAKEVGGDFYDFFLIDNDHLALVIADVSGKGIPAALFMMVSKTLIKNQMMTGLDPAAALEHVNVQLCERNSSMMFVTVWLAVVELSTGKGIACNAGHENPILKQAGGHFELLKYRHNMCIGAIGTAKYHNREFSLHPGDVLFVYTDGVPEACDPGGDMFGEERLTETLDHSGAAGPEALIRDVYGAVNGFASGAAQFDDITMLCLKYLGPGTDPM